MQPLATLAHPIIQSHHLSPIPTSTSIAVVNFINQIPNLASKVILMDLRRVSLHTQRTHSILGRGPLRQPVGTLFHNLLDSSIQFVILHPELLLHLGEAVDGCIDDGRLLLLEEWGLLIRLQLLLRLRLVLLCLGLMVEIDRM